MNLPFTQNRLYKFVSAMDKDMVLDVSQNPSELNKTIVYQWNDGANQKFAIKSVGNGKYAIFCAKNNMVLVPENAWPENGSRIIAQIGTKNPTQFWEFQQAYHPKINGKIGYHLKSFSGKMLDICEQKCKNSQPVIHWAYHGNLNQIWFIQPV